jgi:hypothetical protein
MCVPKPAMKNKQPRLVGAVVLYPLKIFFILPKQMKKVMA